MSEINPVRIPANVEREDKIIADLTARQLAILAMTGVTVWVAYLAVEELLPLPVFGALVVVVVAAGVILALGRRDGVSVDRLLLAALRYARTPHRQVLAPEGVPGSPAWVVLSDPVLPAPPDLPVEAIGEDGVIDLGPGGGAL